MTDTRELVDELRLIGCHANGDARCTCGIGQEAADLITALAERIAALDADKARLDFLDKCNAALNARSGTVYGWAMVMNHNVNRLMTERHHLAIDLHDSKAHGAPSCRGAIDAEMRRIEIARLARAALAQKGGE